MSGAPFPVEPAPDFCTCKCHDTLVLPGERMGKREALAQRPTLLPFSAPMLNPVEMALSCHHCWPIHLNAHVAKQEADNDDCA